MKENTTIKLKQGTSSLPNELSEGTLYLQTLEEGKNKIILDSDEQRYIMGGDPSNCIEFLENSNIIINNNIKSVQLTSYDNAQDLIYPYTYSDLVYRQNGQSIEEVLIEVLSKILPEVSTDNNGDFLRVVNGAWTPQTVEAAETLTYSAEVSASE